MAEIMEYHLRLSYKDCGFHFGLSLLAALLWEALQKGEFISLEGTEYSLPTTMSEVESGFFKPIQG